MREIRQKVRSLLQKYYFSLVKIGNKNAYRRNQLKIRPKLKIALDTQIRQLFVDERIMAEDVPIPENDWGFETQEVWWVVRPNHSERLAKEVDFLASICELARAGEVEFVTLPSVSEEMLKAKEKHSSLHGRKKLDDGIPYTTLDAVCVRMKYTTGYLLSGVREESDCLMEIGRHSTLIKHIQGKKQKTDLWHYILCDSFGIDVFLTADEKFIRAFRQVEKKSAKLGTRTKVYAPSEFCEICGIQPTKQDFLRPNMKHWRME